MVYHCIYDNVRSYLSFLETKKSSINSLLSLAIKPQVIFLAKLVYLVVILAITEIITLVLAIVFMDINIENLLIFIIVLIIGTLDLAVAGCIVSFLTIYAKSKTLAVPVLFFPLILPSILIVTQSTENLVLYNDPIFIISNMLILLLHAIIILTFALLVTDELINQ
jgi:heme exporter protein B